MHVAWCVKKAMEIRLMTDLNATATHNFEPGHLLVNHDADFNSLLSDEVVMTWLMDLEAESTDSDRSKESVRAGM